jgi:hypothetical protein
VKHETLIHMFSIQSVRRNDDAQEG